MACVIAESTWLVVSQVFIVDTRASKAQINAAVARLYDIQTKKINTLIRCALQLADEANLDREACVSTYVAP